jgi:hypothetical protein
MKNSPTHIAVAVTMLGFMFGAAGRSEAGTVISVTGQDNGHLVIGGLSSGSFLQVPAVSWSQTQAYSDVFINVFLAGSSSETVDAYLVRGTVPQPSSSQVAFTSFSTSASPGVMNYLVFSNLTLAAGTYSLVLDSTTSFQSSLGWAYTASPQIVEDTGVNLINAATSSVVSSPPDYPPDSSNFTPNSGIFLDFVVAGNAAVPEPSSFVLASLAALFGLGCACQRQRSDAAA